MYLLFCQNWTLAEQIAIHSRNLTDELQTDLNNRCDILAQNKLHVEDNMKQMEQKFKEDNSSSIGSIKVNLSYISLKLFYTHIQVIYL